jgi:glycosyltransferase involved in cell wall biosynthesis
MVSRKRLIWFSGVGELEAPYNGYKGRWLSLRDSINDCDAQIITTNYVHSRKVLLSSDYDSRYKILDCFDYNSKRGLKRLLYHWIYMIKFSCYLLYNSRKVDTIVFNAIPHINVIGLLLARLLGKHVFIDVRDLWLELEGGFMTRCFARVNRILFNIQVSQSKEVLVTSRKYGNFINRPFHYLPLGYDSEGHVRELKKANIIGFIGNESPQYDLIDAVAKLNDATFKIEIIGSFSYDYIEAVKDANSQMEIEFLGYLDSEEGKFNAMARWSFGLIPNLAASQMGLPTKVFDYLKYCVPVLYICGQNKTKHDFEMRSFIDQGFGIMHYGLGSENYGELIDFILYNRQKFDRTNINAEYKNIIL